MAPRAVLISWLVLVALLVACGRFGFDTESRSPIDGPTSDGPRDAPPGTPDAPPGTDDGAPGDGFFACAYVSCPPGDVTCCETSNMPMCIGAGETCASGHRFECRQVPFEGCTGGEDCCISCNFPGTECIDLTTEECCG